MKVHLLHVTVTARAPFGVAAPEITTTGSATRPSLPLAMTPAGDPYVPGTSVAGSLRAAAPRDRRDTLFGYVLDEAQSRSADDDAPRGVGSAVRVLGTKVTPKAEAAVRRRTAIDRHRGAAANRMLHSRETLPAGTTVEVWLRIDQPGDDSPLAEVLDVLAAWRPVLGGGRTTGHGDCEVTGIHHREIDLGTRAGLLGWLTKGGPGLVGPDVEGAKRLFPKGGDTPAAAEQRLLFDRELEFRVVDALHPGSGSSSSTDGRTVARVLRDADGDPVVPGSTWKGLLRSRAEFLYRSVGLTVCASVSDDGPGTCGGCDVCHAFGSAKSRTGAPGRRGVLRFPDTPVVGAQVRKRNHVALDRVFGGASDGLLFTEEVAEGGSLTLAIGADDDVRPSARAAVVLSLLDLADGLIGIGGGSTRGYGTLAPAPETAAWLDGERSTAQAALRDALDTRTTKEPA